MSNDTDTQKFYNGTSDRVFKTIANSGEEGKKFLEAILTTVFGTSVKIVKFLTVELPLETEKTRKKVLDCLVLVDDKYINVEVNAGDYSYVKVVRNFSYLCSFYSQNVKKGQEYDLDKLYLQINLNFAPTESKLLVTHAYMQNEEGILIKNFGIWDINVENIKKLCYNDEEERDKYKYILMLDEDELGLEEFYPDDSIVRYYKGELMRLNSDADFVKELSEDEENQKVFNTEKKIAYNDGVQSGLEQKNIENARKMKEKGLEISLIKEITGLSEEEITKL